MSTPLPLDELIDLVIGYAPCVGVDCDGIQVYVDHRNEAKDAVAYLVKMTRDDDYELHLEIVDVPGHEYGSHPSARDAVYAILRRLYELPETVHEVHDEN